jgi:OCT family organic cation transporter-like MFS transporter 4/5
MIAMKMQIRAASNKQRVFVNFQAEIYKALPFFLFGGIFVASGLLILLIPETLNQKLPDTVEEAESLGRRQRT